MADTPSRRLRLPLVTLSVLLALVTLALVTLGWALACRQLDREARHVLQENGWDLATGPARWTGWPLAASVVWPQTRLRSGPGVAPPLLWTATALRLRLSPLHPATLGAIAEGAQSLELGAAPPIPYTARDLHAEIDLSGQAPFRLESAGLDAATPNGRLTIAAATLILPPNILDATLTGIIVPAETGHPITPPIDRLHVLARIDPAIQPMPTPRQSATLWRDQGGLVQLRSAALRWGPLDATGHATIRLDRSLQPALTGEVTAAGLPAVLDALAQNGAITRANATAAQAMLLILSAPTAGGPVTLPVTIEDGTLAIARFPLLRLPPLDWD